MEGRDLPEPARTPEENDLLTLCSELNTRGANYIVVGGMAVIHHGYLRATEDIDLLIEDSTENLARVRRALEILPEKAIRELEEGDLARYTVVRIADEIVVDLMLKTCGFSYHDASEGIESKEIEGVSIPFASAELLLKMKQTPREKDKLDRMFLERKIERRS